MPDVMFAADRAQNSRETISFVSEALSASLLGTHKRDPWFSSLFGYGPISCSDKVVDVSEKGCRAKYTARLNAVGRKAVGGVEACLGKRAVQGAKLPWCTTKAPSSRDSVLPLYSVTRFVPQQQLRNWMLP